jgi:hypothetical protein
MTTAVQQTKAPTAIPTSDTVTTNAPTEDSAFGMPAAAPTAATSAMLVQATDRATPAENLAAGNGLFRITTVVMYPPAGAGVGVVPDVPAGGVVAYADSDTEGRWVGPSLDMGHKPSASSCRPPAAALLRTTEVHGQQTGQAADRNADKPERFHQKLPRNNKVVELARLIARKYPKLGSKNAIALGFTKGDKKEALSLLRQVRRYNFG